MGTKAEEEARLKAEEEAAKLKAEEEAKSKAAENKKANSQAKVEMKPAEKPISVQELSGDKQEGTKQENKSAAVIETKTNVGKDEAPPKPPARSKASRMDSTSSENKSSQEGAGAAAKVPINHQDSVQPQQSTGITGYIKGIFSCMTSRK